MIQQLQTKHWLVLWLVALVVGWFAIPATETGPPLAQARRDVWELAPLPTPRDATTLAIQVASAAIWGAEPKTAADETPIENKRWRLAGVYGAGKVGGVLVLFEDERKLPQRLKVGERLPSGHRIEAVDGRHVS